jgi:hypothetical protein
MKPLLNDSVAEAVSDSLPKANNDVNTPSPEISAESGQRALLIGKLVYVAQPNKGVVQLDLPEARLLIADSPIDLSNEDIGRHVVIQMGSSDILPAVVLGLIQSGVCQQPPMPNELVLQAHQQIELRCGSASIVLTANGKIMIRGDYVVSRSSGVNRIDGASVQIN